MAWLRECGPLGSCLDKMALADVGADASTACGSVASVCDIAMSVQPRDEAACDHAKRWVLKGRASGRVARDRTLRPGIWAAPSETPLHAETSVDCHPPQAMVRFSASN